MGVHIKTTMGRSDWALLLLLSFLWGGSFFFVEIAVTALPPLTLVTIRVGLAAIVLWLFILAQGRALPKGVKIWLAFFVMGLINNVIPFTLIVWGQTEIASGYAAILNATAPLFTVIVASALLSDEKATILKLIGVLIGFTGVVVMVGPGVLKGMGAALLAQFSILGAALSYSFAGVYGRRFKAMAIDPVITAAGQVTASTLILLPVALFLDKPFALPMPDIKVWASVIALAVFSTAVAYIIYFKLLSSAGATNLLLVTFLVPVSAIGFGTTILGEELRAIHLVGMALIGAGLVAIDGRLVRRRKKGMR